MKRLLSLFLAIFLLFSLSACSQEDMELVSDIVDIAIDMTTTETEEPTEPVPEIEDAADAEDPPPAEEQTTLDCGHDLSEGCECEPEAEPETEPEPEAEPEPDPEPEPAPAIDEDGHYTTRDDVALYIHTYGRLPSNFMTKKEAEALGWEGGSLEPYAPGMCIGGNRFGNYEGLLPEKDGRSYTECDIDTLGKEKRGAKRIVFSNDGLIYYTDDHYESFTLLYGEE